MKTLFDKNDVASIVKKLAVDIQSHYNSTDGEDLVALVILKGAAFFAVDLLRELSFPKIKIEFVRVSSYQGQSSNEKIKLHYPIQAKLEGKKILVLDEIIDTGFTLKYLNEYLSDFKPLDVKFACLLDKKVCRKTDFNADFVGQEIPNHFVIGYGLDLDEDYRCLPEIKIYNS